MIFLFFFSSFVWSLVLAYLSACIDSCALLVVAFLSVCMDSSACVS